jgi:hypothetical protein
VDDQDADRHSRAPEPGDVVRICRALNETGDRYLLSAARVVALSPRDYCGSSPSRQRLSGSPTQTEMVSTQHHHSLEGGGMALAAGPRLGAYEILAPLGAGGMGEVYRPRPSSTAGTSSTTGVFSRTRPGSRRPIPPRHLLRPANDTYARHGGRSAEDPGPPPGPPEARGGRRGRLLPRPGAVGGARPKPASLRRVEPSGSAHPRTWLGILVRHTRPA